MDNEEQKKSQINHASFQNLKLGQKLCCMHPMEMYTQSMAHFLVIQNIILMGPTVDGPCLCRTA